LTYPKILARNAACLGRITSFCHHWRTRVHWTDEQSVQILNNCRKVIPKNGRLLIIEAVPAGNEPSLAKDFDMVMLVLPGGIERTEQEYKLLLAQAGFRLNSITPTTSAISVVEGRPI
jgi:O-methyltransferase domain